MNADTASVLLCDVVMGDAERAKCEGGRRCEGGFRGGGWLGG